MCSRFFVRLWKILHPKTDRPRIRQKRHFQTAVNRMKRGIVHLFVEKKEHVFFPSFEMRHYLIFFTINRGPKSPRAKARLFSFKKPHLHPSPSPTPDLRSPCCWASRTCRAADCRRGWQGSPSRGADRWSRSGIGGHKQKWRSCRRPGWGSQKGRGSHPILKNSFFEFLHFRPYPTFTRMVSFISTVEIVWPVAHV